MTITQSKHSIQWLIGLIDDLVTQQVNEIVHTRSFQSLEARWRGVVFLLKQPLGKIKIRLLDITFSEIEKDIKYHLEFDQTFLFEKIYSNEFGTPGGEPFGLLIGDYYFDIANRMDVLILTGISQIAAAAFSPFISSAKAASFQISQLTDFRSYHDIHKILNGVEYNEWQRFRQTEDARFIGLTLPNILMRPLYDPYSKNNHYFKFEEYTTQPTQQLQLWGHPGYLFASMVMSCFANNHWFSDLSENPLSFLEKWRQLNSFYDNNLEEQLNQVGFISFSQSGLNQSIYCCSTQSAQQIKSYTKDNAAINVKISSMLKHILSVSRFAHYLKLLGREKIGSFYTSQDCEFYLNQWINQYVAANEVKGNDKMAYPLRNAEVIINEIPGKGSSYQAIIRLTPRLNFEAANFTLQLIASIE